MDQDSRTDESRERALSSEPSSTRPNPFDDGDLSARKRRRTSLSGSRSTSVETTISQDNTIAASDIHDMKIDTPEPTLPSTPARSNHQSEPVSSRVTINLRNADSLEAASTSPTSPTPSRQQTGHVRASVEAPEVDMAPIHHPVEDASSSSSVLDSPEEEASISVGDLEKAVEFEDVDFSTIEPHPAYPGATGLSSIVSDFPFRCEGESPLDTAVRLVTYFRQQPGHVDEGVLPIHTWLNRCVSYARSELRATVLEVFCENRTFWSYLPEVFYHIAPRLHYTKAKEIRDLITQLLALFAKLTAFLLVIDVRNLSHGPVTEESLADLMCINYLRTLAGFPHPEDPYLANGVERNLHPLDPFVIFQSSQGCSLGVLVSFMEYHTTILSQYPRKVMDHLTPSCYLVHAIVRDSLSTQGTLERSRTNLALGYKCFSLLSNAIDMVIEKTINSLSHDNAQHLIQYSSLILKYSLQGSHPEAMQRVQQYRQEHPQVPYLYTVQAIALEWRFQLYCKLIRSRQMQLRVSAAERMCDDLVVEWKRYQDRQQESLEDTQPNLEYLHYLSDFLMRTGIVDYILGPTCHPEITATSFNIVGFLGVTKTYTAAQTDLLWQTLTSTQDPRIAEALVRMMVRVTPLIQHGDLTFLLDKFRHISVDSFTPIMRDLFDNVTDLVIKFPLPQPQPPPLASYEVCVRLLRESSVFTAQGSIAYPEVYQFTQLKLKRLLMAGPTEEGRRNIALSCLNDVASRSATSSGSLQVLSIISTTNVALRTLIEEHNFIPLLIEDFEIAAQFAQTVGVAKVYSNPFCQARRKFISSIITHFGSAIDSELGQRLWDYLVGDKAVSPDDRKAAWDDLNQALQTLKRKRLDSQFLTDCLQLFLPKLPPSCYCSGSLAFVREVLVPAANDINGIILDDEESLQPAGIELLWQIILTAPSQTIADGAILTLVNEIYVDSKSILSYPLQRARKVHFSLVHRCLSQLKSAAQSLTAFNNGATSNGDEKMMIEVNDDERIEQELRFTRTLKVLTTLSSTLQTKSHFAAPDLRSLMLSSPNAVDGDSADLKYQSFDRDEQTQVRPLKIGLRNSAASLLASLREATGFENYRLYFRGTTLAPSQADICKSLAELNIKNGLILVKRELDLVSSPVRIKPGASPLEIEILSHFNDLWEYLSMEEKLAREMYRFLISLPADDSILAALENPNTSPRDVFPLGQPFKSLYAIHALREYLNTRRLKNTMMHVFAQEAEIDAQSRSDQKSAIEKVLSLIVAAICDPDIIDQCSNRDMRLQLGLELVDNFVQLLKGSLDPYVDPGFPLARANREAETVELPLLSRLLTSDLQERLMTILTSGAEAETSQTSVDLAHRCFEALLECCAKSNEFWNMFRGQAVIARVIHTLLLDERPFVRKNISKLISTRSFYDSGRSSVLAIDFAELFWPIILQIFPQAALEPQKCEELFNLASHLLRKLIDHDSDALDLQACVKRCGGLLLSHTSTEDIAHPDTIDRVAHGLILILHQGIKQMSAANRSGELAATLPKRLFLRHLFPPEDGAAPLVPHVILHSSSRHMLYDIIYTLARDNLSQMTTVLHCLNKLTEYRKDEESMAPYFPYKYELPQNFERTNAIRSLCGYSGLRNLSNTCYLNSLFTQLFMNIGFRRFILDARVGDPRAQQLLCETKALFAKLQDSRRRFIDPECFVAQITTYEELPIDIHNQMDVDEFFNLLFDRWEAQFTNESDKKVLRSIYGGQLVQQVKSKECEHISERIELFSAIQCDIKGKSSLEESLQAYVDGEILEGDNKYKCSTCDRDVDAVKRACLKVLPDNLIFHLKRFEFNLRLLQRSKINDYFTFPNKIDMQPYTVEYLSDSSSNAEPDVFELVGVLVHSGTAETGHYYSFIRERPNDSGATSWVEFNDDIVTSWDPSQMESACFGGSDHRQYDGGNMYEKAYSAYMLFYQRSSSLCQDQEMLKARGNHGQLRANIPPELELEVKLDNWGLIQRHNLFDQSHMPFVLKILEISWASKCSSGHKRENLVMRVALSHLDQVASRAKDLPDFDALSSLILTACQRCPYCCFALFRYFQRHKEALRMLLFKNSDAAVRHETGQTLLYALRKIKANFPDEYGCTLDDDDGASMSSSMEPTVVEATADLFLYIWETFYTRPVAWPEYFSTMVDFAKLGRLESGALLDRDFLAKALTAIAADQVFDVSQHYSRLLMVLSRRMATRPPNYEAMIALVDVLMDAMDTEVENYVEQFAGRLSMAQQGDPILFTAREVNILHKTWVRTDSSIFVDKLIQLNQNPVATDSIIGRLITSSERLDAIVLNALCASISGQITSHLVGPYLRAGVTYCATSQSKYNVHRLIRHVSEQCKTIQNIEVYSFFEFQRDVFDGVRNTGESNGEIQLHSLRILPVWIPGLLGYGTRTVSSAVEEFVREQLFKHGPTPVFEENSGGSSRSKAMITAVRQLAVNLLCYLRDIYVVRGAQATRDTVQPFTQILQQCQPYFRDDVDADDELSSTYQELCLSVTEPMNNLIVDEIEDDASDWEHSVGSSDSLADISNMQVDPDFM